MVSVFISKTLIFSMKLYDSKDLSERKGALSVLRLFLQLKAL